MTKSLVDLLHGLMSEIPDIQISGLQLDARQIQQGDAFCAIQGSNVHGLHYMNQAIDAGACAIIYEDNETARRYLANSSTDIRMVPVSNLAQHVSAIAARFYDDPSENLTVTAITGTNGKTTCAYIMAQMLESQGCKVAIVGTLGVGPVAELRDGVLTTPDAISLQRLFAEFRDAGFTHIVMEASSHALAQHRLDAVKVDVAAFTNLSQDHLDYHGSMRDYLRSKKMLFRFPGLEAVVLNADVSASVEILRELAQGVKALVYQSGHVSNEITQQFGGHILAAFDWVSTPTGLRLSLKLNGESCEVQTSLLGQFNIANLLLCLQAMRALGYELSELLPSMPDLMAPPGRLQKVAMQNVPTVIIDYAHTPDALENVLTCLNDIEHEELIAVFGCGGDRDSMKRPVMGSIAERLADVVIITDDNPRTERSTDIIEDIVSGLKHPEKAIVISDRSRAIRKGVTRAKLNDIVLIAGKGHENYQLVGEQRLDFNDYQVALDALYAWRES